jgi:nucleotide-binding universal stress UspA family protein
VTLLCAYDAALRNATPPLIQDAFAKVAQQCEAMQGGKAKELEAQGVKTAIACVEGYPAREIIHYAQANGMDLIAMATHGKGEMAWVLGSVAEK